MTWKLVNMWLYCKTSKSSFLVQSEYAGRLAKIEAERQTLAESVTAAERRVAEEKMRADGHQQQLKSAKAAAETAKQELQDYKHKASRILQVSHHEGMLPTLYLCMYRFF